ncbi:MAG: hypothetical protein WB786_03290 [Thermoplasmata archaeon]
MAKIGGTKGWVVAAGVALLLALVAIPALSGAASAASVTSAVSDNPSTQWAYGGQGWSNNTLLYGNVTITWNAAFGWTVVFTVTPTTPGTWMLEEQRTVGITISASYAGPILHATYNYHGQEVDTAFANLTNQSFVYVSGQPVPALGIDNASAAVSASISESASKTIGGQTASATLDVMGIGNAATSFSPSLGLIPLNLSGVNEWNSTATGSPTASWNVSYSWTDQAFNGTTGSGSGSKAGSLSGSGPVNLTGFKVHLDTTPVFRDGKDRTAIVLVVQGVFDNYDGFIFVPHAFDLFGTAAHDYDATSLGSAGISAQTLYVSSGSNGPSVTAASTSFGANDQSVNALATPVSPVAPAAGAPSPSGSVLAQPMSVAAANAEANCLTNGCGGVAAAAGPSDLLLIALVGIAVALVVGTVGVVEWRSYARRQSQKGLVGGYGESWPNGVPPAGAISPPTMGSSDGQNSADVLQDRKP